MGVYIKGMEMPKEKIFISITPDGEVQRYDPMFGHTFGEKFEAVSVPTHGRLIEETSAFEHVAEYVGGYVSLYLIKQGLQVTPTVIPAEPNEARREYEAAVEQVQYCELHEPTYDPDTGAL